MLKSALWIRLDPTLLDPDPYVIKVFDLDPDPYIECTDPQHWLIASNFFHIGFLGPVLKPIFVPILIHPSVHP